MALDSGVSTTMDWVTFFVFGWGAMFTVYVVVQTVAVILLKGKWRILVSLPIPVMVFVAYVTFKAYAEQSNLWPIWMILLSPVALGYVGVVAAVAFIIERRARANGSAI